MAYLARLRACEKSEISAATSPRNTCGDREKSEKSEKSPPHALHNVPGDCEKSEKSEKRWPADPRPDLSGDSPAWTALLRRAFAYDGDDPRGLYGALHGLRCEGATLVFTGGRCRITHGEIPAEVYARWRERWLLPHREVVTRLLTALQCAGGR